MKISVDNLGAVKNLNVDLSKKLIIFCGPNGTGKTYACYMIYGYLKLLFEGISLFKLDNLIEKKQLDIDLDYSALYKLRELYLKQSTSSGNIKNVFGVRSVDFFNSLKVSDLSTLQQYTDALKGDEFMFSHNYGGVVINYKKEKEKDMLHVSIDESILLDQITEGTEIYHLAIIAKFLCNRSLLYSYILPVERNSTYTFGNELAANRFKEIVPMKEQNYPLAIKDSLAEVVKLKSTKNNNSESIFQELAKRIENEILHGSISISEDGALQFISDKAPEITLPVHLSASIVKNISGLLVYLKHQAKNNELLIIDEPEIGLHPDNQILLARIFARLINNGVRLLISTHSDYIIRELNNLTILSSEKEKVQKKSKEFGYDADERINPADIGAYLFNYNSEGGRYVTVEELTVEQNGFDVETIDNAISTLNDRSMELFFSLDEEEGTHD